MLYLILIWPEHWHCLWRCCRCWHWHAVCGAKACWALWFLQVLFGTLEVAAWSEGTSGKVCCRHPFLCLSALPFGFDLIFVSFVCISNCTYLCIQRCNQVSTIRHLWHGHNFFAKVLIVCSGYCITCCILKLTFFSFTDFCLCHITWEVHRQRFWVHAAAVSACCSLQLNR